MFGVITLVENEKDGSLIPVSNCNARLVAMRGIAESSVLRLKNEMKILQVVQGKLQPNRFSLYTNNKSQNST